MSDEKDESAPGVNAVRTGLTEFRLLRLEQDHQDHEARLRAVEKVATENSRILQNIVSILDDMKATAKEAKETAKRNGVYIFGGIVFTILTILGTHYLK